MWFKNRRAKARAIAAQQSNQKSLNCSKGQTNSPKETSGNITIVKSESSGSPDNKLSDHNTTPSPDPVQTHISPSIPVIKQDIRSSPLQPNYTAMCSRISPSGAVWTPTVVSNPSPPSLNMSNITQSNYSHQRGMNAPCLPGAQTHAGAYIPSYGPIAPHGPPPSYYAINHGMEYFSNQISGMGSMVSPSAFPAAHSQAYPRAATDYFFEQYKYL